MSMTLTEQITKNFPSLSRTEQRVVTYFQENREQVLISSAATLAAQLETSDATIIRTAKRLGFNNLDALRKSIAEELRNVISPADRLDKTINGVGGNLHRVFESVMLLHMNLIDDASSSIKSDKFETAINLMDKGRRIAVFGIGPSSFIASYFVFQLQRFGLKAIALTKSGSLFADELLTLDKGDLVFILAYGTIYKEVNLLLEQIKKLHLKSILISDSLGPMIESRVDLVLPVARGQAKMMSMHTTTLGLIESLLVGIATQRTETTLANLNALDELRQKLK